MCSKWYRSQFNKFEKAGAQVQILCLNFWTTPSNQNIESSKLATFEICEIFSKSSESTAFLVDTWPNLNIRHLVDYESILYTFNLDHVLNELSQQYCWSFIVK